MQSISVIMPVFNGATFLRDTIASVLRSPLVAELILVDDGSTDDTAAIARTFPERVVYRHQENLGPAAARNRGVELARGEVIGFIDADDLWSEMHPARALEELHRGRADLVFGETQCLSVSEPFGPRFHTFQLGSAICGRDLFDRGGAFNEAMRSGEDVEWFLRARDSGAKIVALPELSLYYRLHSENRTRIHHESRAGLLSALQQSIVRRRGAVVAEK